MSIETKSKSMRIIINADDCGISKSVNEKIEKCINDGILSSTTIMGNMPALEDVKRMYDLYHENISFGIHLNLTEGKPIINSQILLDYGIYKEGGDSLIFNSDISSMNKLFNKEISLALFKELDAQIEAVLDHNIKYSHIDSHHHIHTRPYMWPIIPMLQEKYKFNKIRRMRNYMPLSFSKVFRDAWWYVLKCKTKSMKTTDYFTGFIEFIELYKTGFIRRNSTIELMVHPGGYEEEKEAPMMQEYNLRELFNAEIINYNQL